LPQVAPTSDPPGWPERVRLLRCSGTDMLNQRLTACDPLRPSAVELVLRCENLFDHLFDKSFQVERMLRLNALAESEINLAQSTALKAAISALEREEAPAVHRLRRGYAEALELAVRGSDHQGRERTEGQLDKSFKR
jgi:hypothetical protein